MGGILTLGPKEGPQRREGVIMEKLLAVFSNSYLFCAVFGGTLLVVMFILTLLGLGHDADADGAGVDAEVDADVCGECGTHGGGLGALSFLSLKGIIAFITFYGLSGICFKMNTWGGWFVSVGCGLVMMFVTAAVIALICKLQHSGNIKPESLTGCSGSVYLSIPGAGKSGGRVTVTLPASTMEVEAVADEALETGTPVTVQEYLGNNVYKVVRRA